MCAVSIIAFRLNQDGLRCLADYQYNEAIALFSRGLEIVKEDLFSISDFQESEIDKKAGISTRSCYFVAHHSRSSIRESSGEQYQEMNSSDEGFTFTKPLLCLPAPAVDLISSSLGNYNSILSFVVLFNLALAYHLAALSERYSSKRKLLKALAFYELAYSVQTVNTFQKLTIMQSMAIVNNIGQINFMLTSFERADQCFHFLLTTIMSLKMFGHAESIEAVHVFLPNVWILISKESAAPAA